MESLDIGYDDSRFTTVVHEDLHCAICLNVLKEPMQCRSNEHHFCTACIKRHLENFQTCPSCMEELTLATLKKPSRFLATNLSDLVIRCDYVDRGCPEVVVLANLKTHLVNCEFSPVHCSNEGCTKVMNKRERIHHESQACQFRKLRCDDCRETRKNNDEIKLRLETLEDQISQLITGMSCLTQAVQTSSPQKALKVKEDIIVVGGRNETRLNSAEMFSWSDRAWVQLPPMKEVRSGASSVVYENKVIVAGGRCGDKEDSDTMEALTLDDKAEWLSVPSRLPCKISSHKCLVYKDRLFLMGGSDNAERTI